MEQDEITIEKVTQFSSNLAEAVRQLAEQIGHNYKQLSDEDLKVMIENPWNNLLVARDPRGTITGMITVLIYRIPYTKKAYIEDLVVDEHFRKRGIATKLFKRAIEITKEKGAAYLDLTARPRREESNALYEKFGFVKRETNIYRLVFDYGEI